MAAINTTFGFKDQITQNLSLLNNALTSLNQTLSAMQGQMGTANTAIDNVRKTSERAANGIDGFNSKVFNLNQAISLIHSVKAGFDSLGQSVAECSSLYNFQIEQETKLETVMRNHMKATDAEIQSLKELASAEQQVGIYGDEMILAGAQEIATYIDNVDTLKGLIPVMNSMVAQGVGANATARDIQSYATMIGKVMQGQVGGMSKRGYKFTDEEEQILKTGTEMQKLAVLQQAVLGNFGDMNRALAATSQGRIQQITNEIGDMKEEIGRALIPLSQMYSIVTGQWRIRWYQTVINALNFVKSHTEEVMFVLGALSVTVGIVGTAFLALKAKAVASAIASAVAWLAAFGPVGLVIGAVVSLIGFFSLLFGVANTLGAVFGSVFGFIKTAIIDTFKMAYNAVVPILNGFITFAEFFYNVWKNPIDSVKALFYSFVDSLLSMLGGMGSVFDAILGTSLATKVQNLRNELEDAKKAAVSDDYRHIRRLELMQTDGIVQGTLSGAKSGIDTAKKIESALSGLPNDVAKGVADGFSFGSDGSLKTADSSLVDIADDYKELLSARARERFSLKFSSVTPEINFGDVTITGEGDEDRLIKKLADALLEATTAYTRESA